MLAPPFWPTARSSSAQRGIFYAIDAANGQTTLEIRDRGQNCRLGQRRASKDGPPRVLVGSYDFKLYCFDATNGTPVWTYETGNYINGSCAVADGQTVFGGCDALVHVLNAGHGHKVKEIDAGAYIAASAALAGNRAYFGHYENEFLCVDWPKARWSGATTTWIFPIMASAAVTDGSRYFRR